MNQYNRAPHMGGVFVIAAVVAVGSSSTAAWGQWHQTDKLVAEDAATADKFGTSVAISNGVAIVGALGDDDAGANAGAAYLFDVATGQQLHKLTPEDAAPAYNCGRSVSISGGLALVGAAGAYAAYVFDVEEGQQLHRLSADPQLATDQLFDSVSISGNLAIAGAPIADVGGLNNCGAAYVFDVTLGGQLHQLTADDAAPGDWFGKSVSLSGELAIVGARQDDDDGENSGSAYLFDATTGQQLHKLTATDAAAGDTFGVSVSISGGTAIVGAQGDDDTGAHSGSAYLFDVMTGEQLHKLTAVDAEAFDFFGQAVAISGGIAVVGAFGDDDGGGNSGSAYFFDVATGQQLHKVTGDDSATFDNFGRSVAISGGLAIFGAPGDEDEAGSAYIFERACPADVNADSEVNVMDLITVILDWGCQEPPDSCIGDVNFDAVVDVADVVTVVLDWGPCGAP